MRDRCGDLDHRSILAKRRNNAVGESAFKTFGISEYQHALALDCVCRRTQVQIWNVLRVKSEQCHIRLWRKCHNFFERIDRSAWGLSKYRSCIGKDWILGQQIAVG